MSTTNEPPANEPKPSEVAGDSGADKTAGENRRKSAWATSYEAINYVCGLPRAKLRVADMTSDMLLALAILVIVVLSFTPQAGWQIPVAFICDAVCIVAVVLFLGYRLGILRTLSEKQAVLVWDVVTGAFVLGVLVALNSLVLFKFILRTPGGPS